MGTITIKSLLEAGVHFGHQTRYWNPKMAKYIFDERNNIHIIDLQKTVRELRKAYKYVSDLVAGGKEILFVGTKKQAKDILAAEAARCGTFYVSEKWLGGTMTNFATIRRSVFRLEELNKMKDEGIFELLSKKEASYREKERSKLEQMLKGIKDMQKLPGAIFIVDTMVEKVAVAEARKTKVPIVAICDTDANPDIVDLVVPGNDDAVRSLQLFISVIADAVLEGKSKRVQPGAEAVPVEGGVTDEEMNQNIPLDAPAPAAAPEQPKETV